MGFLDHSTNNIILDAVLTDTGRQFLARQDGQSFSIVKFAFGDDEVDYSLIQKFGRTVGKEKIEKNTPIFEALTNQNFAQKHTLVSVNNKNLIRFPQLDLITDADSVLQMGGTNPDTINVVLEQSIQNETTIDSNLLDQCFDVQLSNLFLQIEGGALPINVDSQQRARYLLERDEATADKNGSRVTFTLGLKAITEAQFTVFGTLQDKNQILTFVKVQGTNSGAVHEFQVTISK